MLYAKVTERNGIYFSKIKYFLRIVCFGLSLLARRILNSEQFKRNNLLLQVGSIYCTMLEYGKTVMEVDRLHL